MKYVSARLLVVVFAFCGAWGASAQTLITPDQTQHFSYQGRIDFSDPAAPVLSWPATRIDMRFEGTEIAVLLDDNTGNNFYSAYIDRDWSHPILLDLLPGKHRYGVADNLPAGEHQLTLVKRTEGEEGLTRFGGVDLGEGAKALPAPELPERRMEIYGDSITSGMGVMAPLTAGDGDLADKNAFMSYGAITARALGADYRAISQSGIGVMISWFDFIMPDFYDQLTADGDNDSQWDFSQWAPQVVVVNLMQNDSWLVEDRLDPVPTEAERIAAYVDFLQSIHSRYPNALMVAALGSMDATKEGSPWPEYIEKAVQQMREQYPDGRFETVFFPFTGYGQHPRVVHNRANAELLTALIKEKMDW
ncbi:GDSL-type esterase/lipase family protein [Gilvimarinus xylanilyticus]|uniref:GDSL-type esterase/lipase family protein n=1 Tax=Gilvimarinus xylanilyticus TaxID=2944139 RepID=A0A9X2I5N6_9GAMM|nr:GDSL-type esterase/lipase family protein [Gilvimarinus xylanilyticus]MCP8900785.1 GDSL-type esterase/lipase family protein [Gilvimarinus xylanilyticus]